MSNRLKLILPGLLSILLFGCFRGTPSEKPPIHIVKNMDTQQKMKPYRESAIFANGSSVRMPVEGTIARGKLKEDSRYFYGKNGNNSFVVESPIEFTRALLLRGQNRFNIYCAPCHGEVGDGKGPITNYQYPIPPTSFHDDRLRTIEDGHIFDVISNGIRNMPSYKEQIPVADRWAIVGYVRALQRSQHANITDIPADQIKSIK